MGETTANLAINFAAFAAETPFELVVDDTGQAGNRPVEVEYSNDLSVFMQAWGLASWQGSATGFEPLEKMLAPGQKRVKVYCSAADAPSIKILVDNGEATFTHTEVKWRAVAVAGPFPNWGPFFTHTVPSASWRWEKVEIPHTLPINTATLVGRRFDPLVEAITWSGEIRKRLRYNYDNPAIEIIQKTLFRNRQGAIMPDPVYDPDKGEFHTSGEATGAIVVRYSPGYSLYNIAYDTGKAIASPELFAEMKQAWIFGDIKKAEIPPVRLIALSRNKAVTASFARSFWPEGFPRAQYVARATETEWNDNWVEVAGTRESVVTRLFLDANDPEAFVDIETITYIEGRDDHGRTFRLRMLNHVSNS
ncbi:MAG: hypothetical protein HQL59_06270 [Magnetococcales bacterium]|nr:hypothetical protein [Magnetococcales bacterium]